MTEKSKPQHRQHQSQSKYPVTSSPVLFHIIHATEGLTTFRAPDGAMCDMLYLDMAPQRCKAAKRLAACTAHPVAF